MPFITISTNTENKNDNLCAEVAHLVAENLGKPIDYVVARICCGQDMAFGGTNKNKGALIEIKSVGFSDKALLARKLTDVVVQHLKVEARFVNIEFVNLKAEDVSVNGGLLG